MTSCRQSQAVEGIAHQCACLVVQLAMAAQNFRGHFCVGDTRGIALLGESFGGEFSRGVDSFSDGGGGLTCGGFTGYFIVGYRGELYLYVYSVEERSADSFQIFRSGLRCAGAGTGGIAVVSALAWIHGAYQHKGCRVGDLCRRPRHGDASVLQRLTERLGDLLREFGELVQK